MFVVLKIMFYGLDSLSGWCLVYISVEKFISIAYSSKTMLKRNKSQIIFYSVLCLFNIIYHINNTFALDVLFNNNVTVCDFVNDK